MGPSICRLKLASSKILKYEKLSLPLRLMMVHWDRPTLFSCFPGCLIGISNLIYLTPKFLLLLLPSFILSSALLTQKMKPTTWLFYQPNPIQQPFSPPHTLDSSCCCYDPGPCPSIQIPAMASCLVPLLPLLLLTSYSLPSSQRLSLKLRCPAWWPLNISDDLVMETWLVPNEKWCTHKYKLSTVFQRLSAKKK